MLWKEIYMNEFGGKRHYLDIYKMSWKELVQYEEGCVKGKSTKEAISWAAERGHLSFIKQKTKWKPKSFFLKFKESPLWISAKYGHWYVAYQHFSEQTIIVHFSGIVEYLLDKKVPIEIKYNGSTPLYVASEYGHLNVVKVCLIHRMIQFISNILIDSCRERS